MENNLKFEICDLFFKIVSSKILNEILGILYIQDKKTYQQVQNTNIRNYTQSLKILENGKISDPHYKNLLNILVSINQNFVSFLNESFNFEKIENFQGNIYQKFEILISDYINFLAKKIQFVQDTDGYINGVIESLKYVFLALIKTNLHLEEKGKNIYLTKKSLEVGEINDLIKFQVKKSSKIFYCDFDDFGLFNKLFGHHQGDKVIENFMKILDKNFSGSQSWYRYGGEEFVGICSQDNNLTKIKNFFVPFEDEKIEKLLDYFLTQEKEKFLDLKNIQKKLGIEIFPINGSVVFWHNGELMVASTRRYKPHFELQDLRPVRWKIKKQKSWGVEIFVSIGEIERSENKNIFEKIEKAEKIAIGKKRNEVLEIENSNWREKISL